MDKEKYTLDFAKDYIEDMQDYFKKFTDDKPNYVTFNKELLDNLDFDLLKKELEKANMLLEYKEEEKFWFISKIKKSK